MRTPILALAAIALAACAKTTPPAADSTASSTAMMPAAGNDDAKAALAKLRDDWVAAANKKDVAAVSGFYTDDAAFVTTESPLANGHDAITAALTKTFAVASDLKVDSKRTEVSGDIGYDYGTFTWHITPPKGKAFDTGGNYIVTFKKQSDGSWKIAEHVATTPPKS
jgi:uncharacterized protein (TIGR02246 family)